MPKSPEQWLEEALPKNKGGVFKLFLGYAPGVGKTYNMLSEALRRHSRGEDVVIGVVETHGRKAIEELASKLETLPRKKIDYKGAMFEEMDVDAILARKPHVVLVDELAHTNVDGSKHRKRYEDVLEVLDASIDVLSTMNIQHLESATPLVQSVTGIQVRETVPDWVLQRVNEVVMADLTPEALQNRMRRGDIYPAGESGPGSGQFLSRGKSDRTARTGTAPSRTRRGPESRILSSETGNWPSGCGPGTNRSLHQLQPRGSVSNRTRGAHGPGD